MMNYKKTFFLVMPMLFVAFGFYLKYDDEAEDVLVKAINANLQNYHYDPVAVNDDFSEKAFDLYMKNVDPNKRMLLQSDVDELAKFKDKIDDQTINGTYEFFNSSLKVINKRTQLTEEFFTDILSKPFEFEATESVSFDEDIAYAKTKEELKERWRKYLKYNVLARLYTDKKAQDKLLAKKDTVIREIPMDSLERKARFSVRKTHVEWYSRLKKLDRKKRLASYINSLTAIYDPHTNYFPPADKENFDIQMSGQLEGIGAQLQEKDGYIKITNIIAGGPASLQGDLKANDLILKVKQEGEEAVSIVDWRIDDAVKLIRGKKGTIVTLTVRKPDETEQDIEITRDVVVLDETYAKSVILKDESQVRTGYIFLPSFYADFRNPRGRFSWKDVKKEVEKLKAENVKGIILDLRNNGGGSLDDVVKMGGLFIDEGPICQVKEKGKSPHILSDKSEGSLWDGALVIMVNEFSASASEIMAAAMQDYGRAVIVGSSSTHGKGSVQRFLPINQTLRSKNLPDLGSLKLTIQKFYRINGDATQLKGVSSDVLLPDNYMYIKTGEKEHEYAMAWDQIRSSKYDKKAYSYPNHLIKNSKKRIAENPTFTLIEKNARRWERQRENDEYSLNWAAYAANEVKEKEEGKKFEDLMKDPIVGLDVSNLSSDEAKINEDESKKKRNEEWIKRLSKDPYVYEALQIIEDWN